MDAQEVAVGWWPGDARYGRAAFYAYAHPAPEGFRGRLAYRAQARWDTSPGRVLLDWDDVRSSPIPTHWRWSSPGLSSVTPALCVAGTLRWRPAQTEYRLRSSEPAHASPSGELFVGRAQVLSRLGGQDEAGTASANPSFSLVAVTRRAARCTWASALPMAMLNRSGQTSSTSFGCRQWWLSPRPTGCRGRPGTSPPRPCWPGMGHVEVVRLGWRRGHVVPELVVGSVEALATASWSSLTPTILATSSVSPSKLVIRLGLELDGPGLPVHVRPLEVGDIPIGPTVDPH